MATLAEVDRRLAELRAAESTVTTNLFALEENPTYKLLGDGSALEGTTAARVRPALEDAAHLWQSFSMLTTVLDRAEELRGTEKRATQGRVDELYRLLTGPSIALPPTEVPLAERGLLSAARLDNAITPADLLAVMGAAFERVRDAVAAVEAAWGRLLPALERAEAELARLDGRARELGVVPPPALAAARAALRPLAERVSEDPLGVGSRLDADVAPRLAAARADLDRLATQRQRVHTGLAAGAATLAEIEVLLAEGRSSLAEARRKVAGAAGLLEPLGRDALDHPERGLVAWRERLRALAAAGRIADADAGLARWERVAGDLLAAARAVATANAAPVRRRRELRGLLGAARAKAGASGLAEEASTTDLHRRASALLMNAPCKLDEAERLVAAYLSEVNRRSVVPSAPPSPMEL